MYTLRDKKRFLNIFSYKYIRIALKSVLIQIILDSKKIAPYHKSYTLFKLMFFIL